MSTLFAGILRGMKVLFAAFAIALIICVPGVFAKRRTMAGCEKLKDDHAYNKCLASFGPKRGASRSGRGYRRPRNVRRSHGRARRNRYRGIRIYRSKGRVRTIISVPRR